MKGVEKFMEDKGNGMFNEEEQEVIVEGISEFIEATNRSLISDSKVLRKLKKESEYDGAKKRTIYSICSRWEEHFKNMDVNEILETIGVVFDKGVEEGKKLAEMEAKVATSEKTGDVEDMLPENSTSGQDSSTQQIDEDLDCIIV